MEVAAVEETFKRLQSHRGVEGVLVVNADGVAIRSTLNAQQTVAYAALAARFAAAARRAVKALSSPADDELRLLRIRGRRHEVVLAPEFDRAREYCLVVVQAPAAE
jgi:dynein light chain roadblock-type